MSVSKRPKQNIFSRNDGLNRSLRVKERKKRVHEQVHVDLQERLDREIKIRDGATRLIAACTHENQLLEAAKTLFTSDARTMAYMNELQRLKAAEVMDSVATDAELSSDFKICTGRVALSDIRIPLIWKDYFANNKSKDQIRYAVFCLITINCEVQDTELVCIDSFTADISFEDVVVFEKVSHDDKILLEIYCHPMSCTSTGVSAATPQKLISRLNRSTSKENGKRTSGRSKVQLSKNKGPQYEKLAKLILTLDDIDEEARSHDIHKLPDVRIDLPLYDNIICRLAAQPRCLTEVAMSGFLHYLEMISAAPSWSYLWCELRSGKLRGWRNPEDSGKHQLAHLCVEVLANDVRVNQIERSRQKRAHSFQIRDYCNRHIFAADVRPDMNKWIKGVRQHRTDYCAWGSACHGSKEEPMFIASPRAKTDQLLFNNTSSVVRKTLVYEQLNIDSPIKALSEVIQKRESSRNNNGDDDDEGDEVCNLAKTLVMESEAPWASFFTGALTSATPSKVNLSASAPTDGGSHVTSRRKEKRSCYEEIDMGGGGKGVTSGMSEEGSDDAFLSESDEDGAAALRKKRQAPQPPPPLSPANLQSAKPPALPLKKHHNNPPSKPPLPRLPPAASLINKNRRIAQTSVSSASSLDDILEEGKTKDSSPSAVQSTSNNSSSSPRKSRKPPLVSCNSVGSNMMRSEKKVKKKPPLRPAAIVALNHNKKPPSSSKYLAQQQQRSQSVDHGVDHGSLVTSRTRACSTSSVLLHQHHANKKPLPTPRRSYLHAVESSQHEPSAAQQFTFRQLKPTSTNTFHQQPALPPKEAKFPPPLPLLPPKKKASSSIAGKEGLYAKVDIEKKRMDRARKASLANINESPPTLVTAHKAIIDVCKRRMEEENV